MKARSRKRHHSQTRRSRVAMTLSVVMWCGACTGESETAYDLVEAAAETSDVFVSPDDVSKDRGVGQGESVEPVEEEPGELFEDASDGPAEPDGVLEDGVDAGDEACHPGSIICQDGVRYSCTPLGQLTADPCPPGMICLDNECVDNVTRIYIIIDNESLAFGYFVDPEIMEAALNEASDYGSICPEHTMAPYGPYNVLTASGGQMRTQLLAALLVRRLIDAFAEDPATQVVLIHRPSRTDFSEDWTQEDVCVTGYHDLVFLPPYDDHHAYDTCTWETIPRDDLEKVFPYSVYGYPDPWSMTVDDIARYVDGVESVRDTGMPCSSSEECGVGACYLGTCWVHENDELRTRILHPWETRNPDGLGLCDTRLLYLAAEFIRNHGTSAGRPCSTDADCRPAPGRCGEDHVCMDEAVRCVRQHVLYVAGPCVNGPFLVNFAKWMRNNLYCDDKQCKDGACVAAPNDNDLYPCYYGLPEPAEMCVPAFSGQDTVASVVLGWGSPRILEAQYATQNGQEINVTTHMVLAGAGSPHPYYPEGPLLDSLGTAVAGGGRWVIPSNGHFPMDSDLIGPFAGHWEDQLEDLVDFIKQERASFVCAP